MLKACVVVRKAAGKSREERMKGLKRGELLNSSKFWGDVGGTLSQEYFK